MIILIIYIVGFLISLVILHKYKNELGMNSYDRPHSPYYDDFTSNAQAYMVWSLVWPLFWFGMIFIFLYKGLMWVSNAIGKKFGK